jgi:hypothetical protein
MLNYPDGAVSDPSAPYNQIDSKWVAITAILKLNNEHNFTNEEVLEELIIALMNYREGKKSKVQVNIEEI